MHLGQLSVGQKAKIVKVGGEGPLRLRFLDMGLIPGTEIKLMKIAPMGDPIEVRLRGYELTMRMDEAEWIEVESK